MEQSRESPRFVQKQTSMSRRRRRLQVAEPDVGADKATCNACRGECWSVKGLVTFAGPNVEPTEASATLQRQILGRQIGLHRHEICCNIRFSLPTMKICLKSVLFPNPSKPMAARLFVGNLPFNTTENDLQDHFGQAGSVVSVNIMQDRMTGRSRGFGFVEMSSLEEAQKAIALFHQKDFQGRALTVDSAKPREQRPSGGGPR
jgi:cold-inducible RNA-binding protein